MSEFPVAGILPKEETGAARLIAEHPKFDGRGQIIAVLDQGVDPGADGLRITTEGKPKVIDIIDTTGSGDVDTSKQVKTEIDSTGVSFITGLTGRKLIIPDGWNNTTQTWNIGLIDLTRIFPSYLKTRMGKEQKEKIWSPQYNDAYGAALKKLNDLEKIDVTQMENFLAKESAKEECEHLKKLGTDWNNKYFRTDLIIWTDETGLKGCLDSSFSGDLSSCKVMSDYSLHQEWHCLSSETCLNYSFKIFSSSLCSVVCPSGSHGTHVAGIAAAYHPDDARKNGVAPGAQILSIKIGDSRLDTLETQAGLIRAIRACVQAGCHIANYSYGEPARYSMKGAIARELKEAFLKHHLLFVTSAGNSGPALTTVGAPASLTDYVMSVGAYAAPSTHCPIYSMRAEVPEVHYTWSSRGPTHDGSQGVAVSAPGVAITAVPTATLQNNQLMNGTSMASPNAAGSCAVALSAINSADKEAWSPASLKRAFMNSARSVPGAEKEAQGCGLIQVDRAVETLTGADRTHYNLKVASTGQRGIYLREPHEVQTKRLVSMSVKPEHPENMTNEEKVAFEKHCLIKNAHPWISAPQFLHLSSGEKAFGIEIDATQIPAGSYRSERLQVVESGNNHKVLFNIPITVVRPLAVEPGAVLSDTHHFTPGDIKRMFYRVPNGATYCSVTIECVDAPARYMFHAVQLQKGRPYTELNEELFLNLSPKNAAKVFSFKVVENGTLEVTMARFWSSDGHGGAKWDIKFGGVKPSSNSIMLTPTPVAVDLTTSVAEMISPTVRLEKLCMPLVPADYQISTLDFLPYDVPLNESLQSYRAKINFSFSLTSKGEVWVEVPLLNGLLYESDYAETLVHIFDSNNKMVHTCEVLKCSKTKTTLDKGDYKMVVHLASTNRARLETASKGLVVNVLCKLAKVVKVDTYWSQNDAVLGINKNKDMMIRANEPASLYLGPSMTDSDQPDLVQTGGRSLVGTMKLCKLDQNKKVENFEIAMTIHPKPKAKKETPPKPEKDNSIENLEREQRVAWVKAGHGQVDHFNKTKETYPAHVPLYHARLQFLTKDAKDGNPVTSDECAQVCAEIINLVDVKNVTFETQKKGKLTADETKVKDAAQEEKLAWILAKTTLIRAAVASMAVTGTDETGDGEKPKQNILAQLKELQQMVDFATETKDVQIIRMNVELGRALDLHGWELKNLSRLSDISSTKDLSQRVSVVYNRLSWPFAEQYQLLSTNENFPHAQLFI